MEADSAGEANSTRHQLDTTAEGDERNPAHFSAAGHHALRTHFDAIAELLTDVRRDGDLRQPVEGDAGSDHRLELEARHMLAKRRGSSVIRMIQAVRIEVVR